MMEGHRVKLTEVNPYLVCVLCHGYLVDATTIAECLHSFCRSCIFRQLSRESICPICKTQVHNTKLYRSLRPDKTLQDIVYKLVPGLFHNEMQRRRDFYKNHPFRDEHLEPECRGVGLDRLIYSPDDQISLSLEFYDEEREREEWSNHSSPKPAQTAPSGPKRYLQCPAGFKMLHLKKFLRQKYGLSSSCNVDIMYRRECLPDSYSLMDVAYIYTWKRNSPMRFYYRMPDVIMKQLMAPPVKTPLVPNGTSGNEKKVSESSIKQNLQEVASEETNKNAAEPSAKNDEEKSEIRIPTDSKAEKTDDPSLPESNENVKPKSDTSSGSADKNGPRPVSKNDELPVSVLLSLGQSKAESNDDHKFLVPQGVPPKNGITDKKNNKISLKLSVNKIASDLAENKVQAQQQNNENIRANSQETTVQQHHSPKQKQMNVQKGYFTKQKHIQPKTQQTILQKQQMQLLKQQQLQHKQQQLLQQKQQIQQIIQQQQELQLQIQQQQLQIQLQQKQKLQQQQQKLQMQQQQQQMQQQQQQIHQQQQMQQLHQQKLNSLQQPQAILISTQQHIAPHQSPNPYIEQMAYDCQPKLTVQNSPHHTVLHINARNNMQKPQLIPKQSSQQQIINQNQIQQIQQKSECLSQKNLHNSSHQSNLPQRQEQGQASSNASQLPSQGNATSSLLPQPKLQQNSTQGTRTTSSPVGQPSVPPTQVQTPPPQAQSIKTPPLQNTPPPQNSTPPLRCTPPPQAKLSVPAVNHQDQTTNSSQSSTQTTQPTSKQEQKDQKSPVPHLAQANVTQLCGSNVNINSENKTSQQNSQQGTQQQTQQVSQSNQQAQSPQLSQLQQNKDTNGQSKAQSPQVTLNTSNGSVTIMAQPKNHQGMSPTPNSPDPTVVNGKPPDTPRPQGVHQNLPRTVLPKTSFVNGKAPQKAVPQKNISGQRLNNNLPELRNGLIQQSNINNRLPTFQKNGGSRKSGIPGGVLSKTGPTLDQRIQQLYNSGQTNKPPSPNGAKSESRLASWLNNRFKPQSPKEETESTTPPASGKEVSMIRYKRKLQELQKGQEICEITQENPRPDDAKRRREVMPDVSIELMRAADIKKLEVSGGKKEKRPVPGLKSIQEVGAKRKKEDDSVLDLSAGKPGEVLRPQLPWLVSRPPHFIPRPT